MATTEPCDGCHEKVRIAGGISGLFHTSHGPSGGMTLELSDGSEHFLCFDCIDRLPEDHEPTAEDVRAL